MYGKIFDDIFDSSLMADGGWLPTYIFMSMISMADQNGYVKKDPRTLYIKLGFDNDERVSFDEFINAIELLEKEDDLSNLKKDEGKRLIPLHIMDCEDNRGWLIVNYLHYRDKGGSLEKRKSQDAERQRRKREKDKCHVTVTGCHVMSAHTDIDTDIDTDKVKRVGRKVRYRFTPPTSKQVENYINEKKLNIDADDFCLFYKSKGWMVGKNKMKCWKSAASRWARKNKQESKNGNGQSEAARYLQNQVAEVLN